MRRIPTEPRENWKQIVEKLGFLWHTTNGRPYWGENAYYEFTTGEIDEVEAATQRLNDMMLLAVDYVVQNRMYDDLGIPEKYHDFVSESWNRDEITIYGRFDLAWDGTGSPKLLEYNADTPTSLLEASVIQHHWLEDLHKGRDQFNSIHERLVEAWERAKAEYGLDFVHFTSLNNWEDVMTTTYMRDVATQAGLTTDFLYVKDIGWNVDRQCFTDKNEKEIRNIFKLYPWEFMMSEDFGDLVPRCKEMRWFEAPWKMILSNKGILPILWKLFPKSPYLLEASYEPLTGPYVKKPFLSREGSNVEMEDLDGAIYRTDGHYGTGRHVYQRYAPLANMGGYYAVLGSWVVNGWACGMGVREDTVPITGNNSRFVPHLF